MLSIKFIRENAALVQKSAAEKGYKIAVDDVLKIDDERRKSQQTVDTLRTERKEIAAKMKGGKPDAKLIEQGKNVKEKLASEEENLRRIEENLSQKISEIPNIIFPEVPLGGEEDSVEIRAWGDKKSAENAIDHLEFCEKRDWVDFPRGAKVAGNKFYYLKNELVLLEQAVINFAIDKLRAKNFTLMTVPDLVSEKVLTGVGFAPKIDDDNADYFIAGTDLSLIATAEIPLTGYHMDEILDEKNLPLFYAGLSACFRREAGAAGKHARGLFRVHQFNKLEMYAFCLPENSREIHQQILAIEEEVWQELGVPYHVVNIAAGDLGAPAAQKFDIEYWSPIDQKYREITSCSNCTDFQANSLNIRVRRENGAIEHVHTLNGTAVSLARTLVALIENYGEKSGKFVVPEKLRPYLGGRGEL